MTVGELRKALEGANENLEVHMVISKEKRQGDNFDISILNGQLRSAKMETATDSEPHWWMQLDGWDDEDEAAWTEIANGG